MREGWVEIDSWQHYVIGDETLCGRSVKNVHFESTRTDALERVCLQCQEVQLRGELRTLDCPECGEKKLCTGSYWDWDNPVAPACYYISCSNCGFSVRGPRESYVEMLKTLLTKSSGLACERGK